MGDKFLSVKEARRVYVIEQVVAGKVTSSEAAISLSVSRRQVLRLKKAFKARGAVGLAHGSRGRAAPRAVDAATRERIVDLARGEYRDASYSHMSELLAREQQICVCGKTVGRILKQAGVPHEHTHRAPRKYRSRERMTQEGAMVLMDASPYDWLEGRGPMLSLHGGIDDATSKPVGLYFAPHECTDGYLRVVQQMCVNYGVPARIYTDRHTIFVSAKQLTLEEELAGKAVGLSQFGAVLGELGINHLKARTPQAKGRIERLWGTLQHRLTLEMRLAAINTVEEANAFVLSFMHEHNRKFAKPPANPNHAWRKAPHPATLANIIALRHPRSASNGSTVAWVAKTWRLKDSCGNMVALTPRAMVEIRIRLDGGIRAFYKGKAYGLIEHNAPQTRTITTPATVRKGTVVKPANNHPWKKQFWPSKQIKG